VSTHKHHLPERERVEDGSPLTGLSMPLLIVGVVALVISIIGGCIGEYGPKQFAFSYLYSYAYFWTIACGAFFWIILHHATDSDWSVIVRRVFENMTMIFPVMVVLFIPLLPFLWGQKCWKWLNLSYTEHDPLYAEKWPWFEPMFYGSRWVFFFAFFTIAAYWFRSRSIRQDAHGNPVYTVLMQWWAPLSLVGFGVSLTFSAIDWLMTLNYHWYSTMWGVYLFAGSAQSSMALAIIACWILKSNGYLKVLTQEHAHIMGKLLFAFTVFWAYISFSQYMLIWYANLPEETIFFEMRNTGTWEWVSLFLVYGQFVFPFIFLLTQYMKRSYFLLSLISFWILFMHGIDMYWIVLPNLHMEGVSWSWMDLTCFIAVGCLSLWAFLRATLSTGLFPARDPRILNCLHLTN